MQVFEMSILKKKTGPMKHYNRFIFKMNQFWHSVFGLPVIKTALKFLYAQV